jgi:hypothetical protein
MAIRPLLDVQWALTENIESSWRAGVGVDADNEVRRNDIDVSRPVTPLYFDDTEPVEPEGEGICRALSRKGPEENPINQSIVDLLHLYSLRRLGPQHAFQCRPLLLVAAHKLDNFRIDRV